MIIQQARVPDAGERRVRLTERERVKQRLEVAGGEAPFRASASRPLPVQVWQCGAEQLIFASIEVPAVRATSHKQSRLVDDARVPRVVHHP